MRNQNLPRLPVGPLLEQTGMTLYEIAKAASLPRNGRLWKQAAGPGFTPVTADRLAVACGFTPGEVWGSAWWDLPDGACGAVA